MYYRKGVKKMKKNKTAKTGIVLAVLLLAVGFAAVSTTLYINGTAVIKANTKDFVDKFTFADGNTDGSAAPAVTGSRTEVTGTATLDSTKRVMTVELTGFDSINDEATITFQTENKSQYDAKLGTPAIKCGIVSDYATDTTSAVAATSDYVTVTAGTEIDNATVSKNTVSSAATVKVKQVKSYNDDTKNLTVKFQCTIDATAVEAN